MCFHTSQTKKVQALENRYDVTIHDELAEDAFDIPAYHINGFTHPNMLVIPQEGSDVLAVARWGIVPKKTNPEDVEAYYKKATRFGGGLNAQSEKLFNHFIYKHSAIERRCLIPVTGFYEPHEYKSKKYPYYIHRNDEESFALAGIYTMLESGLVTFTILTKEASPMFAEIHNKRKRQPILLLKDFEKEWLRDDLNETHINEIINANYEEDNLEAYTVRKDLFSPKINSDVESITQRFEYPELTSLF